MPEQEFEAELAPEIREFGAVVRAAAQDAGGFDLVVRSEGDREVRTREVEPLLASLGVFELVPDEEEDQLQAAAAACRAAGSFALPYPVAERLAAGISGIRDAARSTAAPLALAVVDGAGGLLADRVRVNMGDLPFDWWVVETSSARTAATQVPAGPAPGGRLGPFVADLVLGETRAGSPAVLAMALHLQSFTLLGMVESALELTRVHARDRVQFGAPIISFQAVQHQLTDAVIAVELFERQALYALWSLARRRPGMLVDVVGARVAGLRAADVVLRVGHQLHGATGFCDEAPISWLSRHSQPLRRLPSNRPQSEEWFTSLVLRNGFDGLFPSTAVAPDADVAGGNGAAVDAASLVPGQGR